MTTLLLPSAENVGHTGRALTVGFAQGTWDVRKAQRLRYRVFAEEFGARFPEPHKGVDEDAFFDLVKHGDLRFMIFGLSRRLMNV